jgi:hypothetical protein
LTQVESRPIFASQHDSSWSITYTSRKKKSLVATEQQYDNVSTIVTSYEKKVRVPAFHSLTLALVAVEYLTITSQ